MMLKWFKKRQEDKTVSDNVLADKVCKVWNNLDASILDQYISEESFDYSSESVTAHISGKKEYLDYLTGKFNSIRKASRPERTGGSRLSACFWRVTACHRDLPVHGGTQGRSPARACGRWSSYPPARPGPRTRRVPVRSLFSMPVAGRGWGSAASTSCVMIWKPRLKGLRVISFWYVIVCI